MKKSVISMVSALVVFIAVSDRADASSCAGCGGCAKKAKDAKVEKAEEAELQTTCPVMGGKIDKNLYVDHEGKRIYACCKGCLAPIKKDPAKYIKTLADKGQAPAKLQTTCPVMGGKVNSKQYADVEGKRIYVCCPGCIGRIKADPEKYIKKLEDQGVVIASVPSVSDKKGALGAKK